MQGSLVVWHIWVFWAFAFLVIRYYSHVYNLCYWQVCNWVLVLICTVAGIQQKMTWCSLVRQDWISFSQCLFIHIFAGSSGKKKRKSRIDFKQRYRKTFAAMLEEEVWISIECSMFKSCIIKECHKSLPLLLHHHVVALSMLWSEERRYVNNMTCKVQCIIIFLYSAWIFIN